jgi:hypothetical protein
MVKINFNNPIDIDETTGLMYFRKEVSYSGVYNVISVKSTFKDGQFKQTLHVLRLSGQVSDSDESVKVQDPVKLETAPKSGSQVKQDTAKNVERAGARASTFDLTSLLSRGLPSPGLPGMLSDFTGSLTNPLGSLASGAGSLLSSAQGAIGSAVSSLGITNGLSIGSSLNGLNPLSGGIRLPTLPSVASLGNAAQVAAAGNIVSSTLNDPNAVAKLGSQISSQATNAASALSASVLKGSSADSIIPSVGDLTNLANSVGTNAMAAVGKLQDAGSSLISNIGSSVDNLTKSLPSDPTAVASKLGLDPSAIAGLDPSLQGKLGSQLADITKNIPSDVDIDTLKKSGVSLANISGPALKNIPATAKDIIDKGPELPDTKINSIEALTALQTAEANIAKLGIGANIDLGNGVNLAQLNASIPKLSGLTGSLPNMSDLTNATALSGQLASAQSLLGNVTGVVGSVEGNLLNTANLIGGNPIAGQSLDSINSLKNSVASKFGSITASTPSALTKFMNNATSEG